MKRKVVLGMAVFMTAIMVPVQAFAAKPAGGGDYLSGTQEAVESGNLDVDEAIATMKALRIFIMVPTMKKRVRIF